MSVNSIKTVQEDVVHKETIFTKNCLSVLSALWICLTHVIVQTCIYLSQIYVFFDFEYSQNLEKVGYFEHELNQE
jgi:hypothetical protein